MSATTMPGFTPANAMTSAGLSRGSRSRSAAVRSGLATDFSIGVGSAANTGSEISSRQLRSDVFMGFLLCRRLCEQRVATGTASIAPVTHPGEPLTKPMGVTMRNSFRPVAMTIFLAASWTAFGAGGGNMPATGGGGTASRFEARTPAETARLAYNDGVRGVEKGDELAADAARQTDAKKQQKAADKAKNAYAGALKKFTRATELVPTMHEAWNYIGYTHRKLGNFEEA